MTSTGQALGTAVQRTSGAGRVEEGCLSECTLVLRTVLVVQRRKKTNLQPTREFMEPHKKQNITKKEHYIHKNCEEEREDRQCYRTLGAVWRLRFQPLSCALGLVGSNSITQKVSLICRISEAWDEKLTRHGK